MLVENPTYTIPRSPNHITADGSYSLDFSTPSNTNYLTIFRTVGFSGTYTISFWIRPHSVPTTGQLVAPVLSIASATGPSPDYPWIGFYGNGGTTTMRFCVKQGLNDAITCLDSANTSWTVDSSFYHIVFGQYPTPSTTEPYQYTLWMQANAGTRATVTTTYPGVPA